MEVERLCEEGRVELAKRNGEEALRLFKTALETAPSCIPALIGTARALELESNLREALAYAKRAVESDSLDVEAHVVLTCLLERLDDFDRALEVWDSYLKSDASVENQRKAKIWRSRCLSMRFRHHEAVEGIESLIECLRDPATKCEGFKVLLRATLFDRKPMELCLELAMKACVESENDVETRVFLGMIHLALKSPSKAQEEFSRAIDIISEIPNPSFHLSQWLQQSLHGRADCFRMLGAFGKASKDYSRAIGLATNDLDSVNSIFGRAKCYSNMNLVSKAIRDFNTVIEACPSEFQAWLGRGQLLSRDQSSLKDAIQDLTHAVALNPSSAFCLFLRGKAYRDIGEFNGALEDLNKCLEIQPGFYEAVETRASVYLAKGSLGKAADDFTSVINSQCSENIRNAAFHGRGLVFLKLGKLNDALNDLNTAVESGSASNEVYQCRASVKIAIGKFSDAAEDLSLIIKRNPHAHHALMERAKTFLYETKYDAAMNDLDACINSVDSHFLAEVNFLKSLCCFALGKFSSSIAQANESLKLCHDHVRARITLGSAYLLLEKYELSIQEFGNAIASADEIKSSVPPQVYFLRGFARIGLEQWSLALDDFNNYLPAAAAAISKESSRVDDLISLVFFCSVSVQKFDVNNPFRYRALVLFALKDFNGAIEDLTRALDVMLPDSNDVQSEVLDLRGMALMASNRKDEAKMDFERANQLNPYNLTCLLHLGDYYLEQNELALASTVYEKALKLDINNVDALTAIGRFHLSENRFVEALNRFNEALSKDDQRPDIYVLRGAARVFASQPELAMGDFDRALALDPMYPEALHGKGKLLLSYGEIKEAIALFTKAIEIRPEWIQAYSDRGLAFKKIGQDQLSLHDFDKAVVLQGRPGSGKALLDWEAVPSSPLKTYAHKLTSPDTVEEYSSDEERTPTSK